MVENEMETVTLETLDLSEKKLKKLNKPTPSDAARVTTLILDDNELQRLDNIDSYTKVQKLSVVRNQLLRMYGVCRLHSLHTLNLAHNGILTIEGLKDLINLRHLCLAGNNIKTLEHLNTNLNLEHLDLSENSITHITDLSFLRSLKELFLHCNKIGHLHQCDRYLPPNLITLTLASNNINDLNEVSQLVHLTNLQNISVANNPCVNMTGNVIGFDYRPFIINWCMNVRCIDDYLVDAIESLRAEWLYSQGRGRHFRVGDQQELSQYLATVCPLTGEALETEEDRKLRLILSKAQHHQQQLRDQETNAGTPGSSPAARKKILNTKSASRLTSSRLSGRSKSPDRMISSCYLNSSVTNSPLMTQSLDPTVLGRDASPNVQEKCLDDATSSPLQALSKLVPVPESLMSPDYRPKPNMLPCRSAVSAKTAQPVASSALVAKIRTTEDGGRSNGSPTLRRHKISQNLQHKNNCIRKSPSSEDESEICPSKLQMIQLRAEERKQHRETESNSNTSGEDKTERAAKCIQRAWRGYHARNKNGRVRELLKNLQAHRTEQYIQSLTTDMESTKVALESERRIQMLQMQAINALWKKVSTMQTTDCENSNTLSSPPRLLNEEVVKDLARTCNMLHLQIQQLQGSMQDVIRFMSAFGHLPNVNQQLNENAIATQTEISAVHTPQGEAAKLFPFQRQMPRPSSLPLPISQRGRQTVQNNVAALAAANQEVKQFAGSLVDGVIKTVSEQGTEIAEVRELESSESVLENN